MALPAFATSAIIVSMSEVDMALRAGFEDVFGKTV